MKTVVCVVIVILGFVVVSEMDYRDQIAIAQERACIAQRIGQRAVSERRQDGSVSCVRFDNAVFGMAPRFVSGDVWAK